MADAREIYRAWLREVKEDAKEFGQFRADDITSYVDLQYHYDQFLVDLGMSLDEIEAKDPVKWLAKAEKEIDKIKVKLTREYDLITSEVDEEAYLEDEPIIYDGMTAEEFSSAGNKRRKRLFPDLASLLDYLKDVPYPAGIQTVRNSSGKIIGYYIWVRK